MNYSTMISNSTCEVIPNTGHLVPFQDPKALGLISFHFFSEENFEN